MKRWVIGAFCFLFSGLAQSQDKDLKFANDMLVTAKVAGMCGTFKQMFAFQEATQMPGGDEFIERFLNTEISRLGMSLQEFMKLCTDSIESYNKLKRMSE
ncbi:hypothetical protein DMT87_15200 [Salmonella enterica]|nr:hypothetical protein [Salmonella enterica]ECI7006505.1 hypothetical protein [Salmonella enterica subsp. enterica]ECY3648886.1 hypothetical protein [Salmonella enterica subsp. enterica serovar Panama]EDK1020134.1 hypothetical protein [Salmonella enterica]EDS9463744.1 hypothetical protein [Salmonella enterica subsp. enterica serovar Panama]